LLGQSSDPGGVRLWLNNSVNSSNNQSIQKGFNVISSQKFQPQNAKEWPQSSGKTSPEYGTEISQYMTLMNSNALTSQAENIHFQEAFRVSIPAKIVPR
jgi:hypothetical protein